MMRIDLLDGPVGWPIVEALDRAVWPPEVMATVVWRDIVWAQADKRVIAWEGERVVAHAGLFFRDGTLDGRPARMCGIGGVMTAEDRRGCGLCGAVMARAAEAMEGVDFGLLFCEPHNVKLYGGIGWRVFDGTVACAQPSGPMMFDLMPIMCLPKRTAPARGAIDLCGLPW
ncbi:MAG TPA: GNAT family N-acetyltransferase [Rhizomicrobium sp.]|nr:GNAT family N-acetyltransferase [Rhizomicrobium sp.]